MTLATARFEIRSYGQAAATHRHDHHQIVLPLKGVMEMEIAGSGNRVEGARAAVVAAETAHSFAGGPGDRFLIADLPTGCGADALWTERLWEVAAGQPFVELDRGLHGLSNFLAWEAQRDLGLAGASLAGDLLLEALARRYDLAPASLSGPLARAVSLIEGQFDQPLTVAAVAQAVGLSASRLQGLFRERLGLSLGRYLTGCRLKQARRLLSRSELPLVEIALRVGYGDQSAFTRAFQRDVGQSPARFRAAVRRQSSRSKD